MDLRTEEGRRAMFRARLSAKGVSRGRASEASASVDASERSSEPPLLQLQTPSPPSDEAILGMPAREIFQYEVPGKKL